MAKKINGRHKLVGHVLREIRIERNLNQATLEKRSGVDQRVISALEKRGGGGFAVVRQLALALGVTLDEVSRRMGDVPHGDLKAQNFSGSFYNFGHPPAKQRDI